MFIIVYSYQLKQMNYYIDDDGKINKKKKMYLYKFNLLKILELIKKSLYNLCLW